MRVAVEIANVDEVADNDIGVEPEIVSAAGIDTVKFIADDSFDLGSAVSAFVADSAGDLIEQQQFRAAQARIIDKVNRATGWRERGFCQLLPGMAQD